MSNIAFDLFQNCFVLVQNKNAPTDEEWSRWLAFIKSRRQVQASEMRVLVFSAGGSPTATQRAQVHELTPKSGNGVPTAIVTGSLMSRSVVGAMSLFNKNVRAFSPSEASQAFDYLQLPTVVHKELTNRLQALHEQIDLPFGKP